jgi:peptidoglycan/LPS O-acetylase OafA/YrhL
MILTNICTHQATIARRVEETGGRSSGFDYLRIGLALSVIAVHSTKLSYGMVAEFWVPPQSVFSHIILPMFFALSGFLVASSLERCRTLVSFYGLRVLRIVPALFVEVMISALIFGPVLSNLSINNYFADSRFWGYFLNIVGDIHYVLPGVFENNPVPHTVNGQLWTVPYELECYIALGALAVIGVIQDRRMLLAVVVIGQCLWAYEAYKRSGDGNLFGATGPVLILCFLVGVLFFLYREHIVLNKVLFIGALALSIALLLLPRGTYYAAISITYVTVYVGLLAPKKLPLIFSGDYSYGLYLYGYPIQQAFASLGPWTHHWYLNLGVAVVLGFAIARLSWRFVEKPSLALRRYLPRLEIALLSVARSSLRAPMLRSRMG